MNRYPAHRADGYAIRSQDKHIAAAADLLAESGGRGSRAPKSRRQPALAPPAMLPAPTEFCFIRIKEVLAICGKSRSSIYECIQKGTFPAPVKLGGRSSAWIKAEVLAWAENCIKASRRA